MITKKLESLLLLPRRQDEHSHRLYYGLLAWSFRCYNAKLLSELQKKKTSAQAQCLDVATPLRPRVEARGAQAGELMLPRALFPQELVLPLHLLLLHLLLLPPSLRWLS